MESEMENRVGFMPRAAAFMLDAAIVWALGLALQRPLSALFSGAVAAMIRDASARPDAEQLRPVLEWAARWGVSTTLVAPFYALIEATRGWSPGKLVFGLRVVTESGHAAPLSSLLIRASIKSAASVIAVAAMLSGARSLNGLVQATAWATWVGCLLVLTGPRTALHDRIAGTAVLRKTDVAMTAARPRGAIS
jgi:uncharacterized RDD family membrane protein YckC